MSVPRFLSWLDALRAWAFRKPVEFREDRQAALTGEERRPKAPQDTMAQTWQLLRDARYAPGAILGELGIVEPPVDPFVVARALGVEVVLAPHLQYEGALDGTCDPPRIYVRSTDPITRQRFTVSHELGHLMLHPLGKVFRDESLGKGRSKAEVQANRFAARLLMPAHMVRAALALSPTLDELAALFGVSKDAMAARLEALGVVS